MPAMTRLLVGSGNALRRFLRNVKPKLLGFAFIAVVLGLVGLSIAFYNKAFTRVAMVSLKADRAGRQLDDHADVKVRGLVVGEVRSTSTTDTGVTLRLALNPADLKYIPQNVQARILPKTLFGEKFVDLVVPHDATGNPERVSRTIRAGDVIAQDRSATAIELASVFDDLVPVLTAVQPATLSLTLNRISTALQGQGNSLGDALVKTDVYLKGFNPALPQLNNDISKLADLADNLNNDAPAVFKLLDEAAKESLNTQREFGKNSNFSSFVGATSAATSDLTGLLKTNEAGLINLGKVSAPTLSTLKDNGQELPYIFIGETQLTPRIDAALGGSGPYLHINLQLKSSRGPYVLPADCPRDDSGGGGPQGQAVGPNCPGYDKNSTNGGTVVPTPGTASSGNPSGSTAGASLQSGAGSQAEQDEVAALVSPLIGVAPAQISGIADLVLAPQMRGTTVSQS